MADRNNPYFDEIWGNELEEARLKRNVALVTALNLKPYKDGNEWCYLLGENIQAGVCGFGKTPYDAAQDFENNYCTPIKQEG